MPLVLRRHITVRALFAAVAICGGLATVIVSLSSSSSAKAQAAGCSAQSLKGSYLGNISGTSSAGPLAVQAQITFDGNGHGTGNVVLMPGGLPRVADKITYTLASDCTGTLAATRSNGSKANYAIALSLSGSKLDLLRTDPGYVVTGTQNRDTAP